MIAQTDLYKGNMIERYIDRLALEIAENLCFAEFLKRYQLVRIEEENDCQPKELSDEIIENNHSFFVKFPRILTNSSKEKFKCCKVSLVLRYNVPNCHKKRVVLNHDTRSNDSRSNNALFLLKLLYLSLHAINRLIWG